MFQSPTDFIPAINEPFNGSKLPINEAYQSKPLINEADEVKLSTTLQKCLYELQNHLADYYVLLDLYEEAEKEHQELRQTLSSLDDSNDYFTVLQKTVEALQETNNDLENEIESLKLELLQSRIKTDLQERQLSQITTGLNEMNDTKKVKTPEFLDVASRFKRCEGLRISTMNKKIAEKSICQPNITLSKHNHGSTQTRSWRDFFSRENLMKSGGLFAHVRNGTHNATLGSF